MGIERLTQVVAVVAVLAVSSRELPRILSVVRGAQLQMIRNSQASTWGRASFLYKSEKTLNVMCSSE
jgi:hypothetical protein